MKAPHAFRGISEVADILDVRQHRLRAWETRFPFVKPVKRADGRRYYRPGDIAVLRELKQLLDDEKRSVEDILKFAREGGFRIPAEPSARTSAVGRKTERGAQLRAILAELIEAKARLVAVLDLPKDSDEAPVD